MIALKYVAKIVAGQSPQSSEVSDYASGTPFLQGNAEFSMQFPDARYECDTAPKRANTGDILLSVRAPVGALNISDRPYGIGRGLCAVRATDCDPRFLWWWFHSQQSALEAVSMGSTYQAVTAEEVSMLEFPTLQTEEQRRIADFLDAETARIDQLGQMLRGALALLLERDSTNANTAFDGPGPKVQLRRLVSRWVDYRGATPAKTERGVPLITAKNISDGRVEHDRS